MAPRSSPPITHARGSAWELLAVGGFALLVLTFPWNVQVVFDGAAALRDRVRRRSFDGAAWRQPTGVESDAVNLREHMAHDLITSRRLIGQTRSQVLDLLGPFDRADGGTWYWILSRHDCSERTLEVRFDGHGRVWRCE